MRSSSASCISGLPAEMVLTSIHSALRAMSDASAMTSGEDARSSRRNSFRASLSPASAFSERVLSSVRRPLASSESSSAPCTSPLSFAFAVPPVYQVGYYEDSCRVRKLLDRGDQTLQPLQLRSLALAAPFVRFSGVSLSRSRCGLLHPPRRRLSVPSRRRERCGS